MFDNCIYPFTCKQLTEPLNKSLLR